MTPHPPLLRPVQVSLRQPHFRERSALQIKDKSAPNYFDSHHASSNKSMAINAPILTASKRSGMKNIEYTLREKNYCKQLPLLNYSGVHNKLPILKD